uniref:Uncharacterized protein n=1 Tax=Caenorhabditis tropicalis TaxID=1561998 RepID=A0A1I7UWF5_9PELO
MVCKCGEFSTEFLSNSFNFQTAKTKNAPATTENRVIALRVSAVNNTVARLPVRRNAVRLDVQEDVNVPVASVLRLVINSGLESSHS